MLIATVYPTGRLLTPHSEKISLGREIPRKRGKSGSGGNPGSTPPGGRPRRGPGGPRGVHFRRVFNNSPIRDNFCTFLGHFWGFWGYPPNRLITVLEKWPKTPFPGGAPGGPRKMHFFPGGRKSGNFRPPGGPPGGRPETPKNPPFSTPLGKPPKKRENRNFREKSIRWGISRREKVSGGELRREG